MQYNIILINLNGQVSGTSASIMFVLCRSFSSKQKEILYSFVLVIFIIVITKDPLKQLKWGKTYFTYGFMGFQIS